MILTGGVCRFDFLGPEILAASSCREFANTDRGKFLSVLGLEEENLVLVRQIHSANLIHVAAGPKEHSSSAADGMVTREEGLVLGVLTADCVPVFFWDSDKRVAAIAHAGWKGIAQGIVPKVVQALRQNFRSKSHSVRVVLGPCIRQCCYEVGAEFQELFPSYFVERSLDGVPAGAASDQFQKEVENKGTVHLPAIVRDQLVEEGVDPEKIYDSGFCTSCHNDQFYSVRAEKDTKERMLSVISIRPVR